MKRTELRRSAPMRQSRGALRTRSARTVAAYVHRRVLVAAMLEAHPVCQRCMSARATDVHELLSRARGGSILDPENCVCLCRPCHSLITREPKMAEAEGWSRPSWWRPVDSRRDEPDDARSWTETTPSTPDPTNDGPGR